MLLKYGAIIMKTLALLIITLLCPIPLQAATSKTNNCSSLMDSAKNALNEVGLKSIDLKISCKDLKKQINLTGAIAFEQSLRSALRSFFNDFSDIESPLSISIAVAIDENGLSWAEPLPAETIDAGKEILFEQLVKDATISLVKLEETPEMGESPRDSWIFKLKIPNLSDHLYWAVIDRDGLNPVYNYGFN